MSKNFLLRAALKILGLAGSGAKQRASFYRAHLLSPAEPELERIQMILSKFHVDTSRPAVDVGANRGVWTKQLLRIFPQVVAIEPNQELSRTLERHFPAKVISVGVSDAAGTATLWIPHDHNGALDGWGSIYRDNHPGNLHLKSQEINLSTLDDLLEDITPSFIKMDVEGHELKALKGAKRLLNRARPLVLCEVKVVNQRELSELSKEFGYQILPSREVIGPAAGEEMHFLVPD